MCINAFLFKKEKIWHLVGISQLITLKIGHWKERIKRLPCFSSKTVFQSNQKALMDEGEFYTEKFQLINVKGMTALEKSNFDTFNEIAYSNTDYLWILKALMKGGWTTLW